MPSTRHTSLYTFPTDPGIRAPTATIPRAPDHLLREEADFYAEVCFGITSNLHATGIDPHMSCQRCSFRVAQRAAVHSAANPPYMQHLPRGQRPRQADKTYPQQPGRPVDCPGDFAHKFLLVTRIGFVIRWSMQTTNATSNARKTEKPDGEPGHGQPERCFE